MSDLPRILERAQAGNPKAAQELLPLVHDQLHKLTAGKMASQPPSQTPAHPIGGATLGGAEF